ncbi:hypothetical protein DFH28DRAFT_1191851 [Melampsora americana]|nr:hypothetical protein DFH28DRAFT_1191851 [Melampsora americana]
MAVKECHTKWGTEEGWHLTTQLLITMGSLVKDDKESRTEPWSEQFILDESFFDNNAKELSMGLVKEDMNFLHSLIKFKLEHTTKRRLYREEEEDQPSKENIVDGAGGGLDGDIFLVRSPNVFPRIKQKRLAKVFACRRRNSGKQMPNSLSLVSCGVTAKISSFLQFLGLTVSRQTANEAMDTLKDLTPEKSCQEGVDKNQAFQESTCSLANKVLKLILRQFLCTTPAHSIKLTRSSMEMIPHTFFAHP